MREIQDVNGKRTCRACKKTMPLCEFSDKPRRFVCKLCRSRMYTRPSTRTKRTWAQKMMAGAQWDARVVFMTPHNIRTTQIPDLPYAAGEDADSARVVPIDTRTGIASYNGVVVDKVTAKLLHMCVRLRDDEMYTEILAVKYPKAREPIEIVGVV